MVLFVRCWFEIVRVSLLVLSCVCLISSGWVEFRLIVFEKCRLVLVIVVSVLLVMCGIWFLKLVCRVYMLWLLMFVVSCVLMLVVLRLGIGKLCVVVLLLML